MCRASGRSIRRTEAAARSRCSLQHHARPVFGLVQVWRDRCVRSERRSSVRARLPACGVRAEPTDSDGERAPRWRDGGWPHLCLGRQPRGPLSPTRQHAHDNRARRCDHGAGSAWPAPGQRLCRWHARWQQVGCSHAYCTLVFAGSARSYPVCFANWAF